MPVAADGSTRTLLPSLQITRCTEGRRSELSRSPPARTIVAAMIVTPHMLVGAACASKARSIGGALAIGVLSHLALDAVPHRDYRLKASGGLVLGTDLVVGTLGVLGLSRGSEILLAGAAGGVLPDVIALAERSLRVYPVGWAHATAHTDSRPSPMLSASIQGLTALLGALALAKASKYGVWSLGSEGPPG